MIRHLFILTFFFLASYFLIFVNSSVPETSRGKSKNKSTTITTDLSKLENQCIPTIDTSAEWWSYIWCYKNNLQQIHVDQSSGECFSYKTNLY